MALEVGRMFLLLSLEQVYMKLWIMSFAKPPRRLSAALNWPLLTVLFLMCILSGLSCKGFLKFTVNSNVSLNWLF